MPKFVEIKIRLAPFKSKLRLVATAINVLPSEDEAQEDQPTGPSAGTLFEIQVAPELVVTKMLLLPPATHVDPSAEQAKEYNGVPGGFTDSQLVPIFVEVKI